MRIIQPLKEAKQMKRAQKNTEANVRLLAMTALFIALSYVATSLLVIPTPGGGYLNPGDIVVLLGAFLLGPIYGAIAGGVGPALADLLAGYGVYVPATLVIKALMGVTAALLYRLLGKKTAGVVAGGAAAEIIMAGGYCLYEGILGGSPAAGLPGLPANLLQGGVCLVVAVLLTSALKKSPAVRKVFPHL